MLIEPAWGMPQVERLLPVKQPKPWAQSEATALKRFLYAKCNTLKSCCVCRKDQENSLPLLAVKQRNGNCSPWKQLLWGLVTDARLCAYTGLPPALMMAPMPQISAKLSHIWYNASESVLLTTCLLNASKSLMTFWMNVRPPTGSA